MACCGSKLHPRTDLRFGRPPPGQLGAIRIDHHDGVAGPGAARRRWSTEPAKIQGDDGQRAGLAGLGTSCVIGELGNESEGRV